RAPEAGILATVMDWPRIGIAETFHPDNAGLAGHDVGEIARARGQDAFDVALDIVIQDELRTGLLIAEIPETQSSWRMKAECWSDPRTVVGASDAGAHLDSQCGGTLTTLLLSEGVREHGVIELEEAVRQLADVPARLYGIRGRGRIAEGFYADLVMF